MSNPENQTSATAISINFELLPVDNQRLVNLCGPVNKHLRQIEDYYDVKINCRSNHFEISGAGRSLKTVKNVLQTLYNVAGHETLSPATVQLYLNDNVEDDLAKSIDFEDNNGFTKNRRGKINGRGKSQQQYLGQIRSSDLTIGVGPSTLAPVALRRRASPQ